MSRLQSQSPEPSQPDEQERLRRLLDELRRGCLAIVINSTAMNPHELREELRFLLRTVGVDEVD